MRRKDAHITGFPLLPRAIPEERMAFVGAFTEKILGKLPIELVALDQETQRVEVGNIIYHELHDSGFDDRQILTVRDLIVSEFRDQKRGE
jgi:hypothetical protein